MIIAKKSLTIGSILVDSSDIRIRNAYDVIIVGGGIAGIAAAVSAGKEGKKTLLVERDGCLGGTATTGLMVVFMGVNFGLLRGNFLELVDRLKEKGGAIGRENLAFDPEIFKIVAEQWLLENNVELLFHTHLLDVIMEDSKAVGIVVQQKEGRIAYIAHTIVDTSGDADVASAAGAKFQETSHLQPMTSIFRMYGVNTADLISYIEQNDDQFFSLPGQKTWMVNQDPPFFTIGGFFDLIKKSREAGELYLPHDSIWLGPLPNEGEYFINTTRIGGLDGSKSSDLTKAEIDLRKQAWSVSQFLIRHVPGFKHAKLMDIAVRAGVRETRRIVGDYLLTKMDLLEGRRFNDSIAVYDFPMDIHGPKGMEETHGWTVVSKAYDIPYRVLLPKGIDNILLAGRCISVDADAHGSTRAMPACMATGQAAGLAASIAVSMEISPRKIEYNQLRSKLIEHGVYLR